MFGLFYLKIFFGLYNGGWIMYFFRMNIVDLYGGGLVFFLKLK